MVTGAACGGADVADDSERGGDEPREGGGKSELATGS